MVKITARYAVIILMIGLTACVAPTGKGILRTDAVLPRAARLSLATPSQEATAVQTHYMQTTRDALIQMGFLIGADGDYIVETGVSERPLNVEFSTDGGMNSAASKLPSIAICPQRVQRLAIVIIEASSGRPVYQGEAETTQCTGNITDKAYGLARAALAKLQLLNR